MMGESIVSIWSFFRKQGPLSSETAGDVGAAVAESTIPDDPWPQSTDLPYCLVLAKDQGQMPSHDEIIRAWERLQNDMALVPAGDVVLQSPNIPGPDDELEELQEFRRRVRVKTAYLDRFAVSNRQYAQFIAAGGYRRTEFWPTAVLPHVLQFVDRTGEPGPRFWENGRPPKGKEDHPVVGVSWYEACACARWMGKRLPTSAEWQRAACWSDNEGGDRKYPWGNAFDPKRTNTWSACRGDTVPVNEYYEGCTTNGVYQLIGNVWEWVATAFECHCAAKGNQVLFDQPMGEIRGGAFDTYFESQASSHFRSGQPLLYRGANVGFRCCVSAEDLLQQPHELDSLKDAAES